jgi:signal transduction histidine kinase
MGKAMKIGRKIQITYFILLIVTFFITGFTFRQLLHRYLINEARDQLRIEAQSIAETLEKVSLEEPTLKQNILVRRNLKVAGRFIDSKVIVFNQNDRVVYTNLEEVDKKTLRVLGDLDSTSTRDYVVERVPIVNKKAGLKGYVLLFTKVKDLMELNRLMNRTQMSSFIVASIVAIALGLFLQRGLTKPIRDLKHHMTHFSLKDYKDDIYIKTGDEVEELAECFSALTSRLRKYDVQQKRFLQNTSHELKTPLMSIQGYAEAIKDGVIEGKELEESLGIIIDESQRLKKIVDEMMYLMKLDDVEETFHFEKVNLQEVMMRAMRSVKTLADEKGIFFHMEGSWSQFGYYDEEKLSRAFINILSNAIRYAETDIRLECNVLHKKVEIRIIDDGPGMESGEVNKVFERFYKGDKGNTGIGLAITKAIVEGHQGKITACNNENKGAVFKIELPLNR